jgi:hypothetical protein
MSQRTVKRENPVQQGTHEPPRRHTAAKQETGRRTQQFSRVAIVLLRTGSYLEPTAADAQHVASNW